MLIFLWIVKKRFRQISSLLQMDLARAPLVMLRVLRTLTSSIAKNLRKLKICLRFYLFCKNQTLIYLSRKYFKNGNESQKKRPIFKKKHAEFLKILAENFCFNQRANFASFCNSRTFSNGREVTAAICSGVTKFNSSNFCAVSTAFSFRAFSAAKSA